MRAHRWRVVDARFGAASQRLGLLGSVVAAGLAWWGASGVWRAWHLSDAWRAWCGPGTPAAGVWDTMRSQGSLGASHIVCALVGGGMTLAFWGWMASLWWQQHRQGGRSSLDLA